MSSQWYRVSLPSLNITGVEVQSATEDFVVIGGTTAWDGPTRTVRQYTKKHRYFYTIRDAERYVHSTLRDRIHKAEQNLADLKAQLETFTVENLIPRKSRRRVPHD
jgi:hypothetical protein